jgi:tetratricopeptide (TPR) repeat protein
MKSVIIILTIMSVRILGAEFSQCRELLDSGDVFYGKFNNGTALDWYRHAHLKCPDNYEALMKMTRAYIDMGQMAATAKPESLFITGLRFADTLRQRYPDSGQAYFLTSVAAGNLCLIRKGARRVRLVKMVHYNAAKAIELTPDFAPAYIVLGVYYREIALANPITKIVARLLLGGMPDGTLIDSENTLQKALELSPNNIFALLELSRTDILMGKKKEAIEHLKRSQISAPAWYLDGKLKIECKRLLQSLSP